MPCQKLAAVGLEHGRLLIGNIFSILCVLLVTLKGLAASVKAAEEVYGGPGMWESRMTRQQTTPHTRSIQLQAAACFKPIDTKIQAAHLRLAAAGPF